MVIVMKRAPANDFGPADATNDQRHDDTGADFIRIELELADTFCKLALESHSPENARQHRFNARRAMDAAMHALGKVEVREKELGGIITKFEEVKAMLESLEAGGRSHPNC
jgi:hypothetical protein